MPVKPSTNALYYYLGTAPGETRASLQARYGKGWFELLAPSPCPSCLWVSLSLSQSVSPPVLYGGDERSRDWECQSDGASKVGRLCSTGGFETGIRVRRNAPLPLPLAQKAQSKDVAQTDFRWNPDLLLLHVLRGQPVKVLEGQRQGFAGGWRDHWARPLGAAQEPGPAAPRSWARSPRAPRPHAPGAFSSRGQRLDPCPPRPRLQAAGRRLQSSRLPMRLGAFDLGRPTFPFPFFRLFFRRRRLFFRLARSGLRLAAKGRGHFPGQAALLGAHLRKRNVDGGNF